VAAKIRTKPTVLTKLGFSNEEGEKDCCADGTGAGEGDKLGLPATVELLTTSGDGGPTWCSALTTRSPGLTMGFRSVGSLAAGALLMLGEGVTSGAAVTTRSPLGGIGLRFMKLLVAKPKAEWLEAKRAITKKIGKLRLNRGAVSTVAVLVSAPLQCNPKGSGFR
jgi:hypothetical protein